MGKGALFMIIAPEDEPLGAAIENASDGPVGERTDDDPRPVAPGARIADSDAPAGETTPLFEPPRAAPHSRPIPESDGFLKIVLPLPALVQRDSWWTKERNAAGGRGAFAGWRRIAAIISIILVPLLLGVGYLATDYYAPAAIANGFCSDLQARDFGSAYARLSSDLQGQISREAFQQVSQALDEGEGRVTGCDVSTAPGSYGRGLGAATATAQMSIRRALASRQSGRLTLTREDGAWRIGAMDPATLGADLSALSIVSAYCAALREQGYLAAYTLLAQNLQNDLPYGEFVRLTQSAEVVDGAIQTCGVAGMDSGQVGGKATVVASVRRGEASVYHGPIVLDATSGHWEITNITATALGSDLGPLRLGARFCGDLRSGGFDDAYTLFGDRFQSQITQAQFSDDLRPDAGASWTGCELDLRSYHVDGDQAAVDVSLTATFGDGATNGGRLRLVFTRTDGRWSLDGVQF